MNSIRLLFVMHALVAFVMATPNGLAASMFREVASEAPSAEHEKLGRELVTSLAQATNTHQRFELVWSNRRIDPNRTDPKTRDQLRSHLEKMLPQCDLRNGWFPLVLLASFRDDRSRDAVRAYVDNKPLEFLTSEKYNQEEDTPKEAMNLALALSGDSAALDRICMIKFTPALTRTLYWGPSLLSQRKVQLRLLRIVEHPDHKMEASFDYDQCWAQRTKEPRCNWYENVQIPTEALAEALGIPVQHVEKIWIAPDEIQRISAEARKTLLLKKE
jgi:hypothetical protein